MESADEIFRELTDEIITGLCSTRISFESSLGELLNSESVSVIDNHISYSNDYMPDSGPESTIQIRRRQRKSASNIEISGSPNRIAVYGIISRYFTAAVQCSKVVDQLDSLDNDASITLNALVTNTTSKTRPAYDLRIQMLEELQTNNLFLFSRQKNSIFIRKGSAYQNNQ